MDEDRQEITSSLDDDVEEGGGVKEQDDVGLESSAGRALSPSRERKKRKLGATRVSTGAMGSVVKVFVVRTKISYKMPWQRKAPKNSSGSGFTIHPRRILTNAHVVEDSTTVMVRRHGNPKRFVARVVCIGYQCDIALLEVDDEAFWAGYTPLQFGDVPHLQESVTCVGYPTGGDNISVTCGVVSRVDVQVYVNRSTTLLAVQIDAAINSGNSGGPVFLGKKVVGIAFSRRLRAQNIGHIIPVPVIQRFLTEFERRGRITFIDPGLTIAKMESPTLRTYYGMTDDQCGVLVTQINPLSSLAYCDGQPVVQPEDVLMEIDGVGIADDGTIAFRGDERIGADHLFGMKYAGDKCTLKVLRGGRVLDVETTLQPTIPLVPKLHGFDSVASYFIVGGLVFCPLSIPFLHGWYGASWPAKTPSSLLYYVSHGLPSLEPPPEGPEQVVVLAQILASPVTVGYRAGGWCVRLKRFNGVAIRNMRHLVALVDDFMTRHREAAAADAAEDETQAKAETEAEAEAGQAAPMDHYQKKDEARPDRELEEASVGSGGDADGAATPQANEQPPVALSETQPELQPPGEEMKVITEPQASSSSSLSSSSSSSSSSSTTTTQVPNAPLQQAAKRTAATRFVRFDVGERNQVIVLNTDDVLREEATILATHSIPLAKSPDLLATTTTAVSPSR